jgi:hypothetical protein
MTDRTQPAPGAVLEEVRFGRAVALSGRAL